MAAAFASSANEGTHWAFIAPQSHAPPRVEQADWPRNSIDQFILSEIEKANLTPSPQADRLTLLRRVHLDLIGLPPSPAEAEAFLTDERPDAYERIVDKLLASPHFGERWGRHWLDLARYADSDGYSHDAPRSIWPYRDWVIKAYNDDMPFDQFVIEQLAGDMLPNATLQQRVATGFHRNTQINTEGGVDREQFRVDSIFDRIATTGEVMFGLTFGCAQCHDHKFDPLKQVEFYQMFAFFNQADEPRIEAPTKAQQKARAEHASRIAAVEANLKTAPQNSDEHKKLTSELAKLKKARPRAATTLVMAQRKSERATHRFVKGDFTRPAEKVSSGVPAVLHDFPGAEKANRLDFARWVASRDNPLLARVTINRMWQHYFGVGLVETENDFGTQGLPPTNHGLLDWLAAEFMRANWSRKTMHKLIVTSATYRQSSRVRADLAKTDPYNKLLARQSRLRVDAEIVRDLALTASGLLSRKMGGPGVFPPQPPGCMNLGQHKRNWTPSKGEDRYRRAIYTYRWRATPHPALKVLDTPDAFASCTKRMRSNTPLQALTLLNDPAFFEIHVGLARRILEEGQGSNANKISYAFKLCLTRTPNKSESAVLLRLLESQLAGFAKTPEQADLLLSGHDTGELRKPELAAWTVISRVLLNLDESITRE
ncbi:MAG: hypothetical protein CMO74_05350 [Verrucomicrobiales bacterium]|nr:hypothetical protein [Verrucomicrobiales bacterium]|tara:strand:+ start:19499 stop:21466 length:1968 start_codon:yes stop_codon:yes gene_type:complete